VYAWGNNSLGTLGNGTTVNSKVPVAVKNLSTGVTAIAVGADHSLAVQNGGIYSWGINYYGQLGNGTTSTGANATPGAVIGMSSGVTAIACGSYHSLAVQNGGVYAWGQNGLGALGNGTTTDSSIPVAVTNLASGVSAVAGGGSFSLALRNGTVYAWGYNGAGELGNGMTTNSTVPVAVTGITGTVTAIAAAANSSYALTADGSIWDWGYNADGELGIGSAATQVNRPSHLLAPAGYAYTSVAAHSSDEHVVATLARPDASVATSASATVLGTVAPAGSDASGYTPVTLVLSSPTVSGSVQINPTLSNTSGPDRIGLTLDNSTQASALIVDLNNVYGAGSASAASGAYQVLLTLPTAIGSPDYFNFDFTTVVNAGSDGISVGSVPIDDITIAAPEPASLLLMAVCVVPLLGRQRRRARG
jgi:hypothetical protein